MLEVICPRDGTVHHADEKHAGQLLRCANCGDAVQIGKSRGAVPVVLDAREGRERAGARVGEVLAGAWKDAAERPSALRGYRLVSLVLAVLLIAVVAWSSSQRPDRVAVDSTKAPIANVSRAAVSAPIDVQQQTDDLGVRVAKPAAASPDDDLGIRVPQAVAHAPAEGVPSRAPIHLEPGEWSDTPLPSISSGGDSGPARQRDRSLPTGTRIRPDRDVDGMGILTIDNSGGEDAEVKVIPDSEALAVRDVFVRKMSRATCKGLRPDSYTVMFAVGEDWNSATRRFTRARSFYEVGKSLAFHETRLKDGIGYSHHEITLFTLPDGNVSREPIGEDLFDSK